MWEYYRLLARTFPSQLQWLLESCGFYDILAYITLHHRSSKMSKIDFIVVLRNNSSTYINITTLARSCRRICGFLTGLNRYYTTPQDSEENLLALLLGGWVAIAATHPTMSFWSHF